MDNIYILQRDIQEGITYDTEILGCFKSIEDAQQGLQKVWKEDKNAFDIRTVIDACNNGWSDNEDFKYSEHSMSIYVADHLKSYVYNLWIEKFDVK